MSPFNCPHSALGFPAASIKRAYKERWKIQDEGFH